MWKKLLIILIPAFFVGYNKFFVEAEEWKCDDYKDRVLTEAQFDKVIAACNAEIDKDRRELRKKEGQTRNVAYEVNKIDRKIRISQNFIKQQDLKLKRLRRSIGENKADIEKLDRNIKKLKNNLGRMLYTKYQYKNYSTIEVLFSGKTLSQFFQNKELIEMIEKQLTLNVKELNKDKKSLELLVGELEERDVLEKELMEQKKNELAKIERNKRYKQELLGILKKEVGAKKNVISSKEKIKQEILRRKFTLASGAKVSFGDAYNIIRPYKKALGLDPAFVLAVLFQESGHRGRIGGNIGRCYYNQKNPCGKNTVMSPKQKPSFVKIMKGLGQNPAKQKVSCPICRDGAYGGAMGPAQFMPTTWMAIRSKAARIIGKRPEDMSPFTNHDAFIASGTLLRQNYYSSACSNYAKKYKHISSERTLRERCAAAMYYAGPGGWYKHRMDYGESVVRRANRFRHDIKILNE